MINRIWATLLSYVTTAASYSQAVYLPASAFAQALVLSIEQSQAFATAIEGQFQVANSLLTATIFTLDKRRFGQTVKLEVGWTLRRIDTGVAIWQESIVSELLEGNVQMATEGATRNHIEHALGKISKLNL
jgi:hypothetical protein